MFGAKDTKSKSANIKVGNIDTVISEACDIKGDVSSKGNIKIEGRLEGNISAQGTVIIAQKGEVRGDVSVKSLVVLGSIEGSVHVDLLHLKPTARIVGEINAKSLEIEAGAVYQGMVNMKQMKTVSNTLGKPAEKTLPSPKP